MQDELRRSDRTADPNSFEVLALVFGFQGGNVKCQLDNAVSILRSRLTRCVDVALEGSHSLAELTKLTDYRTELLWNYRMWCRFIGEKPVQLAASVEKATLEEKERAPFGVDSYGHGAAMEVSTCCTAVTPCSYQHILSH
jgi:hypothetical protein